MLPGRVEWAAKDAELAGRRMETEKGDIDRGKQTNRRRNGHETKRDADLLLLYKYSTMVRGP